MTAQIHVCCWCGEPLTLKDAQQMGLGGTKLHFICAMRLLAESLAKETARAEKERLTQPKKEQAS